MTAKAWLKITRILLIALAIGCIQIRSAAGQQHWVTTWGCGPQLTEPGNLPPALLANNTLRQFVHVTLGGKQVRVHFSNAYGSSPVVIQSAHVALASGSLGTGNIDPATDKALTFHGKPSVNIPVGETVFSDPLDYDLPALSNLAISIYFGDISATSINGHPGSRTTSFIISSNVVAAADMKGARSTAHWYIIMGVDVLADNSSKALVTLGDSITDGRGSTTDSNNRWPDDLAQRVATNTPAAGMAVVNMGIGGNGIFGGLGPPAVKRLDRDVLDQSGVRWVIVFEGVNDIGGNRSGTIASNLIAAYASFADKAHARGLRAYGATITPFGGSFYDSPAHEAEREAVNTWFRTNHVYDALIDFDKAVRDPVTVTSLSARYDSGDHLHLNPAGYQAMANYIDLNLFAP
jgi:lysophospholipase L1-like esterase